MLKYTRKQRAAIDRAYLRLEWLCGREGHTTSRKVREALKFERKGRQSITIAKAVIVESAFGIDSDGKDRSRPYTLADLAHMADGCATAVTIGAYLRQTCEANADQNEDKEWAAAVLLAREAAIGHGVAMREAIRAI